MDEFGTLKSAPQTSPSSLDAFKLPGAASLYEQLDKLVLVCLRDGRNFFGWLRSFDQYANLILDNTVERLSVDHMYADVPMGIFVIRGENVMLLGEVDEQKELRVGDSMKQVSEREIRKAMAEAKENSSPERRKAILEWPIPEEF
ncbi:LSM domain containing protein [Gracilaria domingensis]|nr:LSM domain containing protein [Gracilaria domingensis]